MRNIANIRRAKANLIIPVENQVRELDPKLLLACIAARRGFTVVIGSHREVDFRIATFPRSLYLNKSMTARNLKMFRIMQNVGHEILTWDEEALVHLPPEIYYSRRLDSVAIRYVSHLFAWGENNAELWRQYPDFPGDLPIHVTGNPRNDLLRTELRPFYQTDIANLRSAYGNFVLVNTNFNHVNAYYPVQNLFKPVSNEEQEPEFGKAAVGMPREYAEGLRDHKQSIFDAFKEMIPQLEKRLPDHQIVVRPHPTESQDVYKDIAAQCKQVHVTNEGNVVPWLLASKAVIHNGCTTGVEAYMLGVPAVSYRAKITETYDLGFYRLPNLISHQCFDIDQLFDTLARILKGEVGAADGDDRKALVNHYLAAQDGSLACERIVDVLDNIVESRPTLPKPPLNDRISGRVYANYRRIYKYLKRYIPGTHAPAHFHRHRYPGISLEELRERILLFQQVLGDTTKINAVPISAKIFRISAS
jgi:surface carbohydrate biosynthesis protein